MQRMRVTFARGDGIKYISHLDIMRLWERALRRADIPLAYSEGFNPHPRLSLAAPLAVGMTSEAELMDVFLSKRISPFFFLKSTEYQMPPGIDVTEVCEVNLALPSLQSQIRYAEYKVTIETQRQLKEVQASLRSLLALDHLPWQHTRDNQLRQYDLRALMSELWIIDWLGDECVLGMRLVTDSKATGRPEQVTRAVGFDRQPRAVHRTKLILAGG